MTATRNVESRPWKAAVLTAGVTALSFLVLACSEVASKQPAAVEPAHSRLEVDPEPATEASAGQRAYRNPVTGELETPPADSGVRGVADPLQYSGEGLEIETLPDGTMKVDLQGRFRTRLHAQRDENGNITVHHRDVDGGEAVSAEDGR